MFSQKDIRIRSTPWPINVCLSRNCFTENVSEYGEVIEEYSQSIIQYDLMNENNFIQTQEKNTHIINGKYCNDTPICQDISVIIK